MKFPVFTFLVCCLPLGVSAQSISPEVQSLVDTIGKGRQMEGQYVYYPPRLSHQFSLLAKLSETATVEELVALTQNDNPLIRCSALKSLCNKGSGDIISVIESHLNDTSRIDIIEGCLGSSVMVGDYFIEQMFYYLASRDSIFFVNNGERLANLDSIIFYDPSIKLDYKASRLSGIECDEKYYDRVREIARFENIPVAVLTLAKYQKQQDINIIRSYLLNEKTQYYAIWGVREFPDSSFYPLLVDIFYHNWKAKSSNYPKWRVLYQALAQYPNAQTQALFDKTIQTRSKYRREMLSKYVLIAIKKYPSPIFEKFQDKIFLDKLDSMFLNDEITAEK